MKVKEPFSLEQARSLDQEDRLRGFRSLFHFPVRPNGEPCIYLCGNSLGLQPKSTEAAVQQELSDWKSQGVEGHFHAQNPWLPYHEFLTEAMADVVGAHPREVVVMNTLTVNLHLMLVSFYRPAGRRNKIVIESDAFPSDKYAVASQIRMHGLNPEECLLELTPRPGEACLREEDIRTFIDVHGDEIALILLGNTNYYTGQYFNMKKITAWGHAHGCRVGFDCAHGAGNIPLQLHDSGCDFAVWCNYKYLNSGPGGMGGVFVHERHLDSTDLPRLHGWWGHNKNTRFDMRHDFDPIPSAEAWQLSNPPILAMAAVWSSLQIFAKAGMENLRHKAVRLTGYLESLVQSLGAESIRIITPADPEQRGSQLSIQVKNADKSLFARISAEGVIADWREPDVIRVAPVPLYNSFEDAFRFYSTFEKSHRAIIRSSMNPEKKDKIIIVGAGLCGSLLAIRMAQRGFAVTLYEKRPDMREKVADAGRSINLALSNRGLLALESAGLQKTVLQECIPMRGRLIHPQEGQPFLSPYSGRPGDYINSVSRPGLNVTLLEEAARYDNIEMKFEAPVTAVDLDTATVTYRYQGQTLQDQGQVVIGTDGAGSAVRRSMMSRPAELLFNYSQDFLRHGYKELSIPPGTGGAWRIEKEALHIWPRGNFMIIALPNLDGSFTLTMFHPFDSEIGFDQLDTKQKVQDFFAAYYPSLLPHAPGYLEEFFANPVGTLGTIKCFPWQAFGKALIMGDASHAIVPFYGQGMNSSLEDVRVFDEILAERGTDWERVFTEFQEKRRDSTNAIADLAIDNYYEMRDYVDDLNFIRKRKIEIQLEQRFPDYYSKYSLVTFKPDLPYEQAMKRGRMQDELLLEDLQSRRFRQNSIGGILSTIKQAILMQIRLEYRGTAYGCDLAAPIDLSISAGQVRCFYAPPYKAGPHRAGDFVGSVEHGAPVNFYNLRLNPHGNGTHTECLGHITTARESIQQQLRYYHFPAWLASIPCRTRPNGDQVIEVEDLRAACPQDLPEALVMRTLPNSPQKLTTDYSGTNPPYLTEAAMQYMVDRGVRHLLLDLPSVDREEDGGRLTAHRLFWGIDGQVSRNDCTITELIYVPEEVSDGLYLLNLQIPAIELDAVPSKPVIYPLTKLQES